MSLELFGATIDLSFWQSFLNSDPVNQAIILFTIGGWLVFAYVFIKTGADLWADYRHATKNGNQWQWVVLAVDVPALFIQTPKAVEQIFAHLSGAAMHQDVAGKFWHGKKQKHFSFEIVSIEGYIQFLVRTEAEYRDLLEAAVYAQYPEAEITEVEDYVDNIPSAYPHSEYNMMGVEFKLAQPDAYPIRTYEEFEYSLSKDAVFSDPMAALLENFSRIGHGENLWMHIIIEPTSSGWKEKGIELAKELMGGGGGHGHGHGGGGALGLISSMLGFFTNILTGIIQWNFEGGHGHEEEKAAKVELTPGTKKTVEAIEKKIGKIGFKSKIRFLYAARKEVFHPNKCIEGVIGAMNQFHDMNHNALVPYMTTHAHYDRTHKKSTALQNGFVKVFKKRKTKWKKCDGYILNIEELATIWHFPLPFVKTPLLAKAGYKRAEPPSGLPTEMLESPLKRKGEETAAAPEAHDAPPEELPYA